MSDVVPCMLLAEVSAGVVPIRIVSSSILHRRTVSGSTVLVNGRAIKGA